MLIIKSAEELRNFITTCVNNSKSIGFVPTMGALHNGHISLIKEANARTAVSICSIFVNPTQFNNKEDLNKYPITINADIEILEANNCSALFLPSVLDIYPENYSLHHNTNLNFEGLDQKLEGAFRPGHFKGVIEVVSILFDLVQPNFACFGKKDFQQLAIIEKLAELAYPQIKIIPCETFREKNGLAMSSRNMRLNNSDKEKASLIFRILNKIKENIAKEPIQSLIKNGTNNLIENGFEVEYLLCVNAKTLDIETKYQEGTNYIICTAAWLGGVRLIDNISCSF